MKVNARSPYYINVESINLTRCILELYIYTGTQTTDRGTITYTIDTTAINDKVTYEISELVKDYILTEFNGNYTCANVWVDYQTTQYISDSIQAKDAYVQLSGFDGYGYFIEGANPQNEQDYYFSNTTFYTKNNGDVTLAINQDTTTDVSFYNGATLVSSNPIISTTESTDQIRYISENSATSAIIDNGVTTTTINIKNIEECKYTPYKITFINKFGALQDLYFFKRSSLSLDIKTEKYKRNIIENGTYSTSRHQDNVLSKLGTEKLTLNSGYVVEELNEVFKQMLLSERVWITYDGNVLPCNISTSSFEYKTKLNDKLINYTIELDFAFDTINNIR